MHQAYQVPVSTLPVISQSRSWPETGFWEIDPALSPRVYLSDASGLVVAAALVARHLSKRIYQQATQPLYHLPAFREIAINFLSSLSNLTK